MDGTRDMKIKPTVPGLFLIPLITLMLFVATSAAAAPLLLELPTDDALQYASISVDDEEESS